MDYKLSQEFQEKVRSGKFSPDEIGKLLDELIKETVIKEIPRDNDFVLVQEGSHYSVNYRAPYKK